MLIVLDDVLTALGTHPVFFEHVRRRFSALSKSHSAVDSRRAAALCSATRRCDSFIRSNGFTAGSAPLQLAPQEDDDEDGPAFRVGCNLKHP
mmetsp:Transcript_39973/g.99016  ORF Transcript_39973/g.99016 Transcript_39973/m.99016 type:complete len:92 (-) Transcript_39973:660-935(-)